MQSKQTASGSENKNVSSQKGAQQPKSYETINDGWKNCDENEPFYLDEGRYISVLYLLQID